MNVHKHMEAIFVVALAVVGAGSLALDGVSEANASVSAPVMRDVAAASSSAVVTVCAPKAPRHA
jgi:hypothetical protein